MIVMLRRRAVGGHERAHFGWCAEEGNIRPTRPFIRPHPFALPCPPNYSPLCISCMQGCRPPRQTASEVEASSRWWAKWTTPTSRTAPFMSKRSSHQVRWTPAPPATFSVPFSRSSSSFSAHSMRLPCSSAFEQLKSSRSTAPSTSSHCSMVRSNRTLKRPQSALRTRAVVARGASRSRRPSRGLRMRSRPLAGPRKGKEATGVSRPRPQGRHAHRAPCPHTSRMFRRSR